MEPRCEPLHIELSDGVILRGELHLPGDDVPGSPAIVMSHGFSATRSMGLPWFAEQFARAGYVVCLYDHRGIGESDGSPRALVDPWMQTRDMWQVVDHVLTLPTVHPERVALWGSSFSGGEAIVLGALHPDVHAVIANAPFAGLGDAMKSAEEISQRCFAMRVAFEQTGLDIGRREIGPMAVVVDGDTETAFLPQAESSEWFLANGPQNGWTNSVTMAMSVTPPFDPGACAPELAGTALLMVVATDDQVAPTAVALETYERASTPKRLKMIEGHHFSAYGSPAREEAFDAMVEFLDDYL